MMNNAEIVLVFPGPNRRQLGGALLHLPLSTLSLAAWLRRDEVYRNRISIVDMNIQLLDAALFQKAQVVGFSAMTGQQVRYALHAAEFVRKTNPHAVLVWGGIHPSLLPEQTATHPLVDVVVKGEGEEAFRDVVDAVFEGKDMSGLPGTYSQTPSGEIITGQPRGFIDMDDLPLAAYDLIDIKRYYGIESQFDYQSSRGCPFRCGFCYNKVFSGRNWRAKSAEKVVDELAFLKHEYDVKTFAFADDEFFIDIKRAEGILRGLLDRGLGCGIIASCRLDIIRKFSPENLRMFREAGMVHLFFGAESGSDKTLSRISKDITAADIVEGARITAEAGIRPFLSFMSGFPGETFADFKETLDLIGRLWRTHPLITVNGIFPFNAYPGTELFRRSAELGLAVPSTLDEWGDWTFQYEPDNPWLTPRMKRWMETAFYIVRFEYYLSRYGDRHHNNWRVWLLKILVSPLSLSAAVRWRMKWFGFALEWKLFAYLARRTFGYL